MSTADSTPSGEHSALYPDSVKEGVGYMSESYPSIVALRGHLSNPQTEIRGHRAYSEIISLREGGRLHGIVKAKGKAD